MTDKVQLIRQEVERLKIKNEIVLDKEYTQENKWHKIGAYDTCFQLLNFIDSLQKESASEDLAGEIERWIKEKHFIFTEIDEIIGTARHFAEWQENKDKQDFLEKAIRFLNENLLKVLLFDVSDKKQFVEQFKNYIENEIQD